MTQCKNKQKKQKSPRKQTSFLGFDFPVKGLKYTAKKKKKSNLSKDFLNVCVYWLMFPQKVSLIHPETERFMHGKPS